MAYYDAVQGSAGYLYSTPAVAAGASKLYVDIFNAAGSGLTMGVRGIWVIPKTDVAVTGAVAIRADLYRTSVVGTGGTAWNWRSATPDVAGGSVGPLDPAGSTIPAVITARHLPTAGATISEWVFPTYSLGEEAATSMAYLSQYQNLIPQFYWGQLWRVPAGSGLLIKQGAVASAGSVHFLIAFTLSE